MLASGEIESESRFELVDGEIVWLSIPGRIHGQVCAAIVVALGPFARAINALLMVHGPGYRTGASRQNLRDPDISLVTREREAMFSTRPGWASDAPDLAVEVLSPDEYGEAYARAKVPEYLEAGAKVVWLVNPRDHTVRAYEARKSDYVVYSGDAEITLDTIAPGFRANVSSFFPE